MTKTLCGNVAVIFAGLLVGCVPTAKNKAFEQELKLRDSFVRAKERNRQDLIAQCGEEFAIAFDQMQQKQDVNIRSMGLSQDDVQNSAFALVFGVPDNNQNVYLAAIGLDNSQEQIARREFLKKNQWWWQQIEQGIADGKIHLIAAKITGGGRYDYFLRAWAAAAAVYSLCRPAMPEQ